MAAFLFATRRRLRTFDTIKPVGLKILGISAFYHDSAAALTDGGDIVAAAQEERFSRIKHDPAFPSQAAAFCLGRAGLAAADLDAVVFYDKPLLKFERLLETYHAFAPRGLSSFSKFAPAWLGEKLFIKRRIRKELAAIGGPWGSRTKLLFTPHHLAHAASAFFPSPFREAAVLTIDGVGEWATASIAAGSGNAIKPLREMRFPHSVGLLYSAFTYYLGFRVNSGEYKLMGLAPYGDAASGKAEDYLRLIKEKIVSVKEDGSLYMDQAWFDYSAGLVMTENAAWEKLFGFPPRRPEAPIEQRHCDLALAIQRLTEEIVLKMAAEAKRLTGLENLCLAGGVALNCVANGLLRRSGLFKDIWIQPAAGDAGGALGAALSARHIYFGEARQPDPGPDAMQGALLGPEYSDGEIAEAVAGSAAVHKKFDSYPDLCAETAQRLAAGQVGGWFQGRMEWGPRALGNRSILGDPRDAGLQKRLNLKIKFREGFRPFAPSVQEERAGDYFDQAGPSPYMLLTAGVAQSRRVPLPDNWSAMTMDQRLYFSRSDIPAVTHLDYSARVQTVNRAVNPRYWELLEAFRAKTGCAALVNTSFNVRGEPIVRAPGEAYACFMRTGMDFLVMGNLLFDKKEQPAWNS